jgi:hypothetical protein
MELTKDAVRTPPEDASLAPKAYYEANLGANAALRQYGVYARDAVGRVLVEDGLIRMPVARQRPVGLPEARGPNSQPEIHEIQLTADWDNGYYLETLPPMGSFTLRQGTRHVCTLSASASAQDLVRLMPNDAYFGRVAVLKKRGIVAGEQMDRWIVTFLDLHGKRELASVDMHQLEGGFVRIKRAQEGISASIPQSEAQEGHSEF